MLMNQWVPVVEIGSHVKLVEYGGRPMLKSVPMLEQSCAPDWAAGEVDVSRSAFSNLPELIKYAQPVAAKLETGVGQIIDSIRG